MAFFHDFKKFISRGSIVDMAVGIILGASFTKVVNALVNHILMPPLGFLIGGVDFSELKITLKHASQTQDAITIDIGLFVNAVLDFVIVGFSIFIFIKFMNRFHMKVMFFTKKGCPDCKMEIPIEALRCPYCTTALKEE